MSFQCIQLSKSYQTRYGSVEALHTVDCQVNDHEFVCIVGPSGCGKTTFLRLLAGLSQPTSGQILFSPGNSKNQLRTAMVFQDHALFPWMSVLDNVAFGLETQGIARDQCRKDAEDFLTRVGLNGFLRSYPDALSGGMRQRVGLLRAFLADPEILLMDEPLGSLDSQTRIVMQEEILRIWKENRNTVVYVTHDIEEAILLGDRVLIMSGRPGKILQEYQIPLERPRHPTDRDRPNFVEIKWQIWKMLEDEVRKELRIPD